MAGLIAGEAAFFGQDHAIVEAEGVDHGGAHGAPKRGVQTMTTLSQPSR
jgi:hypothetical protein